MLVAFQQEIWSGIVPIYCPYIAIVNMQGYILSMYWSYVHKYCLHTGVNIVSIQGWILSPYRDEYCLHTGVNIVATPPAQFSDTRGPTVAGAAPCRARAPRRGRARPRPRSRWPTEVTMEARTSLAPAAGPRYSEASAGTSQTPRCCRSGHTQMFHLPFKNIWCQDQKYFLSFYQPIRLSLPFNLQQKPANMFKSCNFFRLVCSTGRISAIQSLNETKPFYISPILEYTHDKMFLFIPIPKVYIDRETKIIVP